MTNITPTHLQRGKFFPKRFQLGHAAGRWGPRFSAGGFWHVESDEGKPIALNSILFLVAHNECANNDVNQDPIIQDAIEEALGRFVGHGEPVEIFLFESRPRLNPHKDLELIEIKAPGQITKANTVMARLKPEPVCCAPGCTRKPKTRLLCGAHANQQARGLEPKPIGPPKRKGQDLKQVSLRIERELIDAIALQAKLQKRTVVSVYFDALHFYLNNAQKRLTCAD